MFDGYRALWFTGLTGKHFGIGVGSLVLILSPILLGYTFGCHSLRIWWAE